MTMSESGKDKETQNLKHDGQIADIRRVVRGALFSETFSEGVLNEKLWQPLRKDPGLKVSALAGQLRFWGTTTNEHGLHTTGVVSHPLTETDVVAVASIRASSGVLEDANGAEGYHVQLVDGAMNRYYQVTFGRSRGNEPGWFVRYVDDKGVPRVDPARSERLMNEEFTYVDIAIERDGDSGYATGWIIAGEEDECRIIAVGSPRALAMAAVSLQVSMTTTLVGVKREMQVRSARMYKRHQNTPLVCSVADSTGAAAPNVIIQVTRLDGKTLLGQGATSANGIAKIMLKPNRLTLFPTPVIFKILRQAREIARATVRRVDGENGIYPGDVWAVTLKQS